ncbi:Abi family protein [Collinsella sp. An7]|uniref:Abi family protein n=1 Tax=Collinsella sp. An7 TaxID=1965651 RepID=UPI00117ECD2F|nr:Abi family protein [Collinsella sp. An7]
MKLADGGINHIDSTPHASGNAANQAGSSFSPLPEATTYVEQLSKMKGRGLAVADEGLAIARLRDLNYYRLRGYWLTLERDGSFIEGASFDDIWEIYQLDRGLRTWLWRAIAPVEIKLRTQFAYYFAHLCGADAYLNVENYRSASGFQKAVSNFERERDRAYSQGVPCVVHNMDKYGKLSVWAAVECMSLGTLSMLYGNLDPDTGTSDSSRGVQAEVAEAFGTKPYYLRSWMHHLTTVRNIAAHHDRFYNRVMTIRPALLKRDEKCVRRRDMSKQFPTFLVIRRIYEKSWPEEWESLLDELASCIEQHPSVSLIPMGFPKDWMSRMGAATSRAIIPRT